MEKMLISHRQIQKLTRMRGIVVNRRIAHLKMKLKAGDMLRVELFGREEYGVIPEEIPLDILYEDDDILVVNKAAGLSVHPNKPNQLHTLANGIAYYYQQQGIAAKVRHIHRLDKDTSGTLLLAKHAYAQAILDKDLRERKIHRQYYAVVHGRMEEEHGTYCFPIARDPRHGTRRMVSPNGETAITHYHCLATKGEYSLVECKLETGRTHQIRVHFRHAGHPLVGDGLYGGDPTLFPRQALHAFTIQFQHPMDGRQMQIDAPIPSDLQRLFVRLGLKE